VSLTTEGLLIILITQVGSDSGTLHPVSRFRAGTQRHFKTHRGRWWSNEMTGGQHQIDERKGLQQVRYAALDDAARFRIALSLELVRWATISGIRSWPVTGEDYRPYWPSARRGCLSLDQSIGCTIRPISRSQVETERTA